MRPAPLSLLCALIAPAAHVSAGACGGTSGLRLNHAQVLATHNSYHLATPGFNYSHPPLDVQLERGVRGLELDVFFDNSTKEFRVMREPGVDELSTCADLSACLGVVRAWSDAHPLHFPLFLQLEVHGGMAYDHGACLSSFVESVRLCAIENCEMLDPLGTADCIASSCIDEVGQVVVDHPRCISVATCLAGLVGAIAEPNVTAEMITEKIGACTRQSLFTRVPLGENEAEAATHLVSVLDRHFPPARRVQPADVLGGRQEAELLGSYAHTGEANFWPEVDCSRGRALFAVSLMNASDAYFAVGSAAGLVRVLDDPSDGLPAVAAGALVRTRVDEGLAANPARQQVALASGLHVLSTDVPPPVGPTSWDSNASEYFVLPEGLPVRCNPVTTAGGANCTAAQLEQADLDDDISAAGTPFGSFRLMAAVAGLFAAQ